MPVIDTAHSSREAKNFVSSLFDFSFTSLITIRLIKLLYILGMLVAAAVSVAAIVAAFNINSGLGIVSLLLSPVVFLLTVTYERVVLELIIVFFRIEGHTRESALALVERPTPAAVRL